MFFFTHNFTLPPAEIRHLLVGVSDQHFYWPQQYNNINMDIIQDNLKDEIKEDIKDGNKHKGDIKDGDHKE